eukprot:1315455-Pleurochrysis_carterae.AAC.1
MRAIATHPDGAARVHLASFGGAIGAGARPQIASPLAWEQTSPTSATRGLATAASEGPRACA